MELFIISSLVTRRFGRHNLDPSAICQLRRDNVFLSGWRLTVKIIKKFSIRFLSPVSSSQTNPLKKPFSWWYSIYALNVVKSLFWWHCPLPSPPPFFDLRSSLGVVWMSSESYSSSFRPLIFLNKRLLFSFQYIWLFFIFQHSMYCFRRPLQ